MTIHNHLQMVYSVPANVSFTPVSAHVMCFEVIPIVLLALFREITNSLSKIKCAFLNTFIALAKCIDIIDNIIVIMRLSLSMSFPS